MTDLANSTHGEKMFDAHTYWGRAEGKRVAVDAIDPLLPIVIKNSRRAIARARKSPSDAAAVRTLTFHAAMVSTLRAQAEREAAEAIEEMVEDYSATGASDAMVASVREALASGSQKMMRTVFDRLPSDLLLMAEEALSE